MFLKRLTVEPLADPGVRNNVSHKERSKAYFQPPLFGRRCQQTRSCREAHRYDEHEKRANQMGWPEGDKRHRSDADFHCQLSRQSERLTFEQPS